MNDFEYIKILNSIEIAEFISSIASKYDNQLLASKNCLNENKNLLLDSYKDFENQIIEQYKDDVKNFNIKVQLWNNKECLCGNKLKFNDLYNFWGCTNYIDKSKKHITFSANQEEKFNEIFEHIKVRLGHNWSSEILKTNKLQNKIKAKDLLLFYNSQGLEDLREKYGYKNSLESISSYSYANKNSKKEELEIRDFLNNFFEKISYQVYIKFKKKNENEKIKIIDLIVSDKTIVYLIEIKRHNIYINEEQLDLYYDLVSHLMQLKNDNRKLSSLFIVNEYYQSSYNSNKCVEFNQIKLKTKKEDILKELNSKVYR